MAGHSHWAKIKRKKAVTDQRRGRLWSKLARNIIVAAKKGADPADNLALRYAIEAARAENMPVDTIDKAIKKGSGELGGAEYVPVVYEGYAPGGVAVLVEALTDNPTRTAPEIRKAFERHGGNLGTMNCVAWMFKPRGVIHVSASATDEDTLMEIALESGAEDVQRQDDVFQITCEPTSYEAVRAAIAARQIPAQFAELTRVPDTTVAVDAEKARAVMAMIDVLDENDDVQKVHTNLELTDAAAAEIAG
ncbi:MAG: YebC/PmpR family DNA-binding transcriptional regulator [Phycisphaerae bacterium]|nr:YebC/PmpR family DNA-binding transcriptional regulator [Phycisphaerae bacterium]